MHSITRFISVQLTSSFFFSFSFSTCSLCFADKKEKQTKIFLFFAKVVKTTRAFETVEMIRLAVANVAIFNWHDSFNDISSITKVFSTFKMNLLFDFSPEKDEKFLKSDSRKITQRFRLFVGIRHWIEIVWRLFLCALQESENTGILIIAQMTTSQRFSVRSRAQTLLMIADVLLIFSRDFDHHNFSLI